MTVNNYSKFNQELKNCLLGKPVQEPEFAPKLVNAANGQYNDGETGTAGGYLIPEEVLTLHENNTDITSLLPLVQTVEVYAPTGRMPIIDYSQKLQLVDFESNNDNEIEKAAAVFASVPFQLGLKGAIVNISRDLIADAVADVPAIIKNLFQRAYLAQVTADILAAAEDGAETDTGETSTVAAIDAIKRALLGTLGVSDANQASIVMNQNTFAAVSTIKDETGNYYMQPVAGPAVPGPNAYAIMGKPVVVVENDAMDDDKIIVGNFKQIVMPEKMGLEVMADASVGFRTNSIAIRAITRYCCINANPAAFVAIN